MRYIGDIHGDMRLYKNAKEGVTSSIQVGDMGYGFNPIYDSFIEDNIVGDHRFIRGNHDNPNVCKVHPNYIQNGYDEKTAHFFVNGAWSIDGPDGPWNGGRINGIDWWDDEEESDEELERLVEQFKKTKPRIVVTHEAPHLITDIMFAPRERYISRTAEALQKMMEVHKPRYWIFGHWHRTMQIDYHETDFICLGIGRYVDIGEENI